MKAESKLLEGAFPYSITSDGNVWRGKRRLVQQYKNGRWYAQIYKEDKTKWCFDSKKMADSLFLNQEPLILTKEKVLGDPYNAMVIPDYPRYAVNSWGSVFCLDPPKRGPNAGSVYRVKESYNNGKSYVTLSEGSKKRFISVDQVMLMVGKT